MKDQRILESCQSKCVEELEKRAEKLAASTHDTIVAGNSVVLFTMLVLEEVLEQLAVNPIANLNNIQSVASSIATLNSSLITS